VGYNPIGYHIGTVWPHDNAIAAAGLMRYGFVKEATTIIETMVEASVHFDARLPELFSGLARRSFPFPVAYPTSCSPQAWAAAAPLLFLRTLLRFDPDLRHGRLHLAPVMPEWMGPLRIDRIPVLGGHLSIEVDGSHCEILSAPHGVEIVPTPREA
jgi:glycogen debranching enzyme